jgi:hypothetical protein
MDLAYTYLPGQLLIELCKIKSSLSLYLLRNKDPSEPSESESYINVTFSVPGTVGGGSRDHFTTLDFRRSCKLLTIASFQKAIFESKKKLFFVMGRDDILRSETPFQIRQRKLNPPFKFESKN